MKKVLLIDYENIHSIDLSVIDPARFIIKIFIGQSQNKIPFNLVQTAQRFGNNLEWIKIDGMGKNALDFHIAYFLGIYSTEGQKTEYVVLSKDQGFDPLIRFINKKKISCRRINSILELSSEKKKELSETKKIEKVLNNLKKIDKQKRPRRRHTLSHYINTLFANKLQDDQLSEIVDALFIQEYISEENNRITYAF